MIYLDSAATSFYRPPCGGPGSGRGDELHGKLLPGNAQRSFNGSQDHF